MLSKLRTLAIAILLSAAAAGCQTDDPTGGASEELNDGSLEQASPRGGMSLVGSYTPPEALAAADCTGVGYDAWRSWTPKYLGAPRTMVQPAAGYLDGAIVVQGGRASVTTLNNVSGLTFALATPTCEAPNPDWKAVTIASGTAPKVWGAASAVAAHRFFVIGGTTSGAGACLRTTSYFEFTAADRSAGRWVTLASLLPQGLCQATATTMVDAAGKEWIVLAGGSTRSLPNTSCVGGFAPTSPTLILDPAAATPAWVAQTGVVDDVKRWGGAAATSADRTRTFVFGGSSSTTLTGGASADGSSVTLAAGGKPSFASATALPAPSFGLAAAAWSGGGISRVYVSGGSSSLGPTSGCTGSTSGNIPGSSSTWSFDPATGNFGAVAASPSRRVAHALVAVPAFGQVKLYAIGGADGSTASWTVDEYTP